MIALCALGKLVGPMGRTYSESNLAPEEFQSRAAKREDPLRKFSRICGAELEAMQKRVP